MRTIIDVMIAAARGLPHDDAVSAIEAALSRATIWTESDYTAINYGSGHLLKIALEGCETATVRVPSSVSLADDGGVSPAVCVDTSHCQTADETCSKPTAGV